MTNIFISYRRADSEWITSRIYDRLVTAFGKKNVFKDVDSLKLGGDFRGKLKEATARCDVMLVIIGPVWLTVMDKNGGRRLDNPDDFVRLEVETGLQRDGILVIPVLVGGATLPSADQLPDSLKQLAYNHAFTIHADPLFNRDMEALVREIKKHSGLDWRLVAAFIAVIFIGVVGFFLSWTGDTPQTPTPTQTSPAVAEVESPMPTETPTTAPTNTPLPTPNATELEQTIEASIGQIQVEATQTRAWFETATATLWTPVPTIDVRATAEARLAQTATQAWIDSWTDTPTPTLTPDATRTLEAIAVTGVTRNADWTPVENEFDGVVMVLVPAGCFMMGMPEVDIAALKTEYLANDDFFNLMGPVNEVCIDKPFWLDKTEVTEADFQLLGGVKANPNRFSSENRPVMLITWYEAEVYCRERRNGHLPTEAEWEFAARGPDGFIYPWGNEFLRENVVYYGNYDVRASEVGSRPSGESWVGAVDLSGNVWEWVRSLYVAYPYIVTDGRENLSSDGRRVLRGGSWLSPDSFVRATFRSGNLPDFEDDNIGFRCARSAQIP